eukprot:UN02632
MDDLDAELAHFFPQEMAQQQQQQKEQQQQQQQQRQKDTDNQLNTSQTNQVPSLSLSLQLDQQQLGQQEQEQKQNQEQQQQQPQQHQQQSQDQEPQQQQQMSSQQSIQQHPDFINLQTQLMNAKLSIDAKDAEILRLKDAHRLELERLTKIQKELYESYDLQLAAATAGFHPTNHSPTTTTTTTTTTTADDYFDQQQFDNLNAKYNTLLQTFNDNKAQSDMLEAEYQHQLQQKKRHSTISNKIT